MKKFISPQTGAKYEVLFDVGGNIVCYRFISISECRVRIQGSKEFLTGVKNRMKNGSVWGEVKSGDHLSIVVHKYNLIDALCDAACGVVKICFCFK